VLRVLAALIALRALTNVGKPLGTGTGLVLFGVLLEGPVLWVLGPLLGVYMLAWAYGLWQLRSWAVPMGVAYLGLVAANLLLFPLLNALPGGTTLPMYLVYALVAFGVPALALGLLVRVRRAGGPAR